MVFRNSFVWAGGSNDASTSSCRLHICVLQRHVYIALLLCRLRLTPVVRVRAMYELTTSKQVIHAAK